MPKNRVLNPVTEFQYQSKYGILSPRLGQWYKKSLLAIIDVGIIIFTLFALHRSIDMNIEFTGFVKSNSFYLLTGVTFYWILTIVFNFYDLELVNKTRKVLPLAFFIGLIFSTSFSLFTEIELDYTSSFSKLLGFVTGFTALMILWRVVYASVIHKNVFVKNCLLLTSENESKPVIRQIKKSLEGNNKEHGLKILRTYAVPNDQKLKERLDRALKRMTQKKLIDMIIVMDQDQESISNSLNSILIQAMGNGIELKTYFKLYEEVKEAVPVRFAGHHFYSLLPTSRYSQNYLYLLWYKLVDVIASFLGLSTMLLLTPLITIINFFLNKGPLFYKQTRVGKGGREIEIIKFRSMIVEAEKDGAKMSQKGDHRITRFGKILRKLRIDELPQFWSVLRGDMSLIGPRPERKVFINELIKSIPLYDSRHLVKPGITGWAQVKCEYGENVEDSYKKLEYDLYYIKNRSITLDIRIIFKTINTIIFYKGL